MESNVRAMRKIYPAQIPRSLDETLDFIDGTTDLTFTRHVDRVNKIVKIYNPELLSHPDFHGKDHVNCNGTFTVRSKMFVSFFFITFSVINNGYYIPFMYSLLPNKTAYTHVHMLKIF